MSIAPILTASWAMSCGWHAGIRDQIVQSVELKFNCFFLMPVIDAFPTALREELEAAYEEDIGEPCSSAHLSGVGIACKQHLHSHNALDVISRTYKITADL